MNLVPEQTKITGSIMTPLGFYDTKRPLYLSPDLGKFLVPILMITLKKVLLRSYGFGPWKLQKMDQKSLLIIDLN